MGVRAGFSKLRWIFVGSGDVILDMRIEYAGLGFYRVIGWFRGSRHNCGGRLYIRLQSRQRGCLQAARLNLKST